MLIFLILRLVYYLYDIYVDPNGEMLIVKLLKWS
ncbi:hypothetical protein CHRY9393_01515 [Chryseobacterium fistulae]|uniref:Uncharacterized protein n=1 Tax=Chryseobacterium fistulae TaxID=2675058 RepID=A0A6N4XN33_9FLAO|nr:hypothetical protein CHRY9393_01515 [Chryseobacterium fistulae]